MKMWLDDVREPWKHGCLGWEWVKTAEAAIELLKTGAVTHASLDHDLAPEHYCPEDKLAKPSWGAQTGYAVVAWLEVNPQFWPVNGTRCHSMNPVGKARMEVVIERHYGRLFS